jgi:aminoglycoside 6-adenylyltransferase
VAKGIFRNELPYAMYFLNTQMRDELNQMIEWYIGQKNNFSVSVGKHGKYFKSYLDARQYDMFRKTYANSEYDDVWKSLFLMCDLFREMALEVAEFNNYIYPIKDDENMIFYLKNIVHTLIKQEE